jgi:hypothetical protein
MYGSRRARRAPLALHQLESRDNPNGTVTASVAGGILTLTGDDLDNSIAVDQTGAGSFTVTGAANTAIQGGPNFTGVNSVVANLADGNDVVALFGSVDQDSDGLTDFILPGAVTINAGDGSNILGLTGSGKVQVSGFSYTGGDGDDQVTFYGGFDKGSKVTGNVVINVGIGFNSQGPASTFRDTYINLANLEVGGIGGVRVTAEDGTEYPSLSNLKVTGPVFIDGGDGGIGVTVNGGTLGSMSVKSAGAGYGLDNSTTAVTFQGARVIGPVSVKGATETRLSLDTAELGPTTVSGGKNSFNGANVETTAGASTIHGDLKLTGGRLSMYTQGGATGATSLTVDRLLSLTGSIVDINMGQGSSITAGTLTVTGTHSSQFYSFNPDAATPGKVTVAGATTFRGPSVDFSQYGGEVQVGGRLALIATGKATFTSSASQFVFNSPRAKTTAASILVQGREVEFHQTESDVTAATSFSLMGSETAFFDAFPREQVEDPANPGTYDPAVGATTTVTAGAMVMSAPDSAQYYQTDGVLTLARGLTILAPRGNASYRTDVGDGFDAPGPKLVIPTANVLIRGNSADFLFTGGTATIGGTVSMLGAAGATFETDFGETHDINFDFTDLYPTFTSGTVTVNGGIDSVKFSTFGETFTAHGDVLVKGPAGLSQIFFDDRTGSQVDGNLTVTTGSDFDLFVAWGPLTVGGNLTVDLGIGANDFETGVEGGTTKVTGNVTFKSGSGSDTFELAALEVSGTTLISTGAGRDQLYLLGGSKFTGPVTIDTGGGADLVAIATPLPDEQIPPGPDAFPAGTVEFDAKATIKLGAGNDTLRLGVAGDPVGKVVFGVAGSLAADGGLSLGDFFDAAAGQFDPAKVTTIGFELP